MKSFVAPRRPGESDDKYRERVERARRKRGIQQLRLPLQEANMAIKQKIVHDDGSVGEVRMTPEQYNERIDAFNMALLAACYEALRVLSPTDGFYSENEQVFMQPDENGVSRRVKITATLDTD